jgi:hypothetical protein
MRADFSNKGGNSGFGKKKGGIKYLKEKIIAITVVLVVLGLIGYLVWPKTKKEQIVAKEVEQPKADSTNVNGGGSGKDSGATDPKNGPKVQNDNTTDKNSGQAQDNTGKTDKNNNNAKNNANAATSQGATTAPSAKADYNSFSLNMVAANGVTNFSWSGNQNGEDLTYKFDVSCTENCEGKDYSYSQEVNGNSVTLDLKSQLQKINHERKFKAELKIYDSSGALKKTITKSRISLQCNPD